VGALLAARRERPRTSSVVLGCAAFGVAVIIAGLTPTFWTFALALVAAGVAVQTIVATANGLVQLGTDAAMRGRVIALYMAIFVGGTPIGAPFIGWVANHFGPRTAIAVGGTAALVAALIGAIYLVRANEVRLSYDPSSRLRLALTHRGSLSRTDAESELELEQTTARKL
jgi:MFS family permease